MEELAVQDPANQPCPSTFFSSPIPTANTDRLQRLSRLASSQRPKAIPPTVSPTEERSTTPPSPYRQAILAHRSELHMQKLASAIQTRDARKKLKGRALQIKRELDRAEKEEPKSLYKDDRQGEWGETDADKRARRKRQLQRVERAFADKHV